MHVRSPPCHRFFFALKPDAQTARRIDVYAESISGGARRIALAHQHVTLAITGDYADYPDAVARHLAVAGARVAAAPFDLMLDRLKVGYRSAALRPERRVPALAALQRRIAAEMAAQGMAMRPDWRFSPHLTLFYRDGAPEERRLPGFVLRVESFALVHSLAGRTRHSEIGRWPLTGDDPGPQYALPFD